MGAEDAGVVGFAKKTGLETASVATGATPESPDGEGVPGFPGAGTRIVVVVMLSAVLEAEAKPLALLDVAPGTNSDRELVLIPVGEIAVALLLAPAPASLTKELEVLEAWLPSGLATTEEEVNRIKLTVRVR